MTIMLVLVILFVTFMVIFCAFNIAICALLEILEYWSEFVCRIYKEELRAYKEKESKELPSPLRMVLTSVDKSKTIYKFLVAYSPIFTLIIVAILFTFPI